MIKASGCRPMQKGALQGFVDRKLDPSAVARLHPHRIERQAVDWLAGKTAGAKGGSPTLDPKTGEPAWSPVVEIKRREARERFEGAALDSVDQLLGGAP
jgi:hypothetical protein